MSGRLQKDEVFATPAMADILLGQNLIDEARRVIERLHLADPANPRVVCLEQRLEELQSRPLAEQLVLRPSGADSVSIEMAGKAVRVFFEITDEGIALARRKAQYSGTSVLRLFTAAPGPRGVRISMRDEEIRHPSGRIDLPGLPRPAVHVAAVGFLANTGEFVPLAQSKPLSVGS
jgi:hypothetical protein